MLSGLEPEREDAVDMIGDGTRLAIRIASL
jgi:hypothetical protein